VIHGKSYYAHSIILVNLTGPDVRVQKIAEESGIAIIMD
jgi:hypothetical protein